MSDAIRKHHARNIIAARKYRGKIAACIAAARHRNHISFQPANSSDRCARSFPAQSSIHPNGRATEVVHSSRPSQSS